DQALSSQGAGQQVIGTVVDNLGNTAHTTLTVSLDFTKPTVSVTGVADGAAYTAGSVPTAGCSSSDSLSGIDTPATLDVSAGSGANSSTYTATCGGAVDNAGNANSAAVTYTVNPMS